jgi:hypothetical protein
MKLLDYIKERYLTWKTGKTKDERDWTEWYYSNVHWKSGNITDMFKNFKHVITVDIEKFMNPHEPITWVPCEDAQQYFWPARPIGENCIWRFERVTWNRWENRWYINEITGEDKVFVATNSDRDAVMIALKWS